MKANHKSFTLAIGLGVCLLLAFTVNGLSQTVMQKKDLIFTQVFAGPVGNTNYTCTIAVTNRGTLAYRGTFFLFTGNGFTSWEPLVNGTRAVGGALDVTIFADETVVYTLSDNSFNVGYAYFVSDDFTLDNFIEGNLTYFSHSGSTLLDAVGVPASQEFRASSLPFDYFPDVGLSLVNPGFDPALVRVNLFDEDGTWVTYAHIQLTSGSHFAAYLNELNWNTALPAWFGPVGKVEITSDVGIPGICMLITPGSAAGAQISTLPLDGTPLTYALTFTGKGAIDGDFYTGRMSIWIDGAYARGYLALTSANGSDLDYPPNYPILIQGQLVGTYLELTGVTWPNNVWPRVTHTDGATLYMCVWDFDPTSSQLEAEWALMDFWATTNWLDPIPTYSGILDLVNTIF